MDHTLINTIIASVVVAFIFGMVAKQLKLPSLFGYLLAGVAIGPHTPGFVADVELARQLAEIGIILLMFGVGLHFSIRDLVQSRRIALPGALVQMGCATVVGAFLGHFLGHGWMASLIFGFSLSVASTIVLIRSLEQQKLMKSHAGKLAVSWLIVEDIAIVLALVMLPVLAESLLAGDKLSPTLVATTALLVLLKIAAFFVFMLIVGRKFLPWLLMKVARIRSEELNTLGALAIALGFAAIAYMVFDASLALGAFLAGVMLNESEIGRKFADSSLQLRDAFSVLFFVSVGMLFDPRTLLTHPLPVLMTFLIIVLVKSAAALAITGWFKQPRTIGLPVAMGLAQIGEFSFIFGGVALSKGIIPQELYNLILAGSMLSIVSNAFLFRVYGRLYGKPEKVVAA